MLNFPESMEIDFYTLWAEEILTENNLILDIPFLIFYEFCTCNGKQWRKLCLLYEGIILGSYNFGRLAISAESLSSISHSKVQLLLILIETLNLENLLQMVHDEISFRGICASPQNIAYSCQTLRPILLKSRKQPHLFGSLSI
ncbi:unnamed protein product [Cuscuta europaea]|uniref:Uncharacterized protein n=1 Tax=Cuscuta europaea TaxID=41803 RepID=A0A9P1EDA0_CUSEU|nr:unnamed protein product [Cuscuta europaea]